VLLQADRPVSRNRPPEALARKRRLDRLFFANEQLFSDEFRAAYGTFMKECFAEWGAAAQNAKMKASAARVREERGPSAPWDPDWDRLSDNPPDSRERRGWQRDAYDEAMRAFATDLGIKRTKKQAAE
jgi:hypothetical protein